MKLILISVLFSVGLVFSAVAPAMAETPKEREVEMEDAPVKFYEVVGLEGEIFFSNAEAYGAAQDAGIMPIVVYVSTLRFE